MSGGGHPECCPTHLCGPTGMGSISSPMCSTPCATFPGDCIFGETSDPTGCPPDQVQYTYSGDTCNYA